MPRDAVTITALAKDAGTSTPAGTVISPTNGANIAAGSDFRKLVIRVTNTYGGDKTVTIKAGANPPAFRSGIGDDVITVTASTGDVLIPIGSARFAQADGSINVDFETGMTGRISAIRLPDDI